MIKVYPVAFTSRRSAAGSIPVQIAIYANGQTRYLSTDIHISSHEQLEDEKIVNHPLARQFSDRLRKTLNKIRYSIDIIDFADGLSASEIVRLISDAGASKPRTLAQIYKEYIATARIKDSTARLVKNTYSTIEQCLGKEFYIASLRFRRRR